MAVRKTESSAKKKSSAKSSPKTASKSSSKKKAATGKNTGTGRSKKTSAAKKTNKEVEIIGKSESSEKRQDDFRMGQEIIVLLLFAFSVILMMGFFGLTGKFGEVLCTFLFGTFGSAAYIFPFAFFFIASFIVINEHSSASVVRSLPVFLLFIDISMFFQFGWNADFESRRTGLSGDPFWTYSTEMKRGGGFIGGHLFSFLLDLVGHLGTVIILITIAVICLVMITGKSLVRFIAEGSKAAAASVKDTAYDAYEEIEEKRYRKRYPEGRVMPGRKQVESHYMENTRILPDDEDSDEMHEISSGSDRDIELLRQRLDEKEELKEVLPAEEITPVRMPLREIKSSEDIAFESKDTPIDEIRPVVFEEPENGYEGEEISAIEEEIPEKKETVPKSRKRSVASSQIPEGMTVNDEKMEAYVLPKTSMLEKGALSSGSNKKEQLEIADKLKKTFASFGVNVTVTDVSQGPTVTRYELLPEAGVKVSKILALTDDIKLALAAESIRIEAPIPGKSAIGIEVPNRNVKPVMLRELLESAEFKDSSSKISFAVGKDIGGKTVVFDIAKMPHVLIAGATGAGKSVCINTIIMSILFKARPDEVKLIMIDPKVVELSIYNGIPHLLTPVVTDPQKAAGALQWGVGEMEKRYRLFADYAVRDLKGYNAKAQKEGKEPIPQLVIIVDELADLMMSAKSDVENSIVRLAQKARAAGIHLIIATQRPSVDVITGLIKANMPSRVAFTVTSGTDSRTILDMVGAEKLLGKGDMLFHPVGYPKPARVQGAFVSDEDVEKVAEFVRNQKKEDGNGEDIAEQIEQNVANSSTATTQTAGGSGESDEDELFAQVADFVVNLDKPTVSIGLIQRKFRLGFNRAARIMDQLHDANIVGDEAGTKGRNIIMTPEQFEEYKEENL